MMKNSEQFCVFILTHGRADRVVTYKMLRKIGYTGKIYLAVDDEDSQLEKYREKYGDDVLVFSKDKVPFDPMDNFKEKRTITFARNVAFELAKKVGCRFFIELDDDYGEILYHFNSKKEYISRLKMHNLDAVLDVLVDFLKATPIQTIAMAQGGDFIGGPGGMFGKKIFLRRKAMNSFICDVERPFTFQGTFNEDVNTYVRLGNIGKIFFTNNIPCVQQGESQSNPGGITEAYKRFGTYVKSFYTVMVNPTCCRVAMMGQVDRRIHHKIIWKYAVPKIISEKYRKAER